MQRFLPFWILGAPLVLALIDWARTPKVSKARYADPGARP